MTKTNGRHQKPKQNKVIRWDLLRTSLVNQIILIVTVFFTLAIILVSISLNEMKHSSQNLTSSVTMIFSGLYGHTARTMDELYHLYISEESSVPEHQRRIFNVFKNSDDNIKGIYLLDRNGLYLDGTDENILKGTDFSNQDYVKMIPKLGDTHWSTVNISMTDGTPSVFLSKRFEKLIVVMQISLVEMTNFINTYQISDHSEICITDKMGVYIVNKDVNLVLTRSFDEYIKYSKSDRITTYKNVLMIPYLSELSPDGWRIIVYQSVNDFISPALGILLALITVAILLTAAVNFLGYKRIKVVTTELQLVENKAKDISNGDYIYKPFPSDYVEINTLQETFENLIENILQRERRLEESAEKILKLNEGLEDQIRERTQQLMSTNTELNIAYTNLKEAQSMIVQNEKMAALGQMVSGVAHELNTPIGNAFTASTYIKSTATNLIERVNSGNVKKSEFVESVQEMFNGADIIFRNLNVASGLISNFKQIAVDHQSMEWREFNVYEILKGVVISFNIDLRNANVQLDLRCSEEFSMRSYPGAMVHIVSNLIRNSLLHGFNGREKGRIHMDVMSYEDRIMIVYKDDGVGMSQETLQKIYDPFYTTKRAKGGTGLGMNIVFNYITNVLQGTIVCESILGSGTTFRIELPTYVKPNSDWVLDDIQE